jgi:enolase
MPTIERLVAREILDSRGRPTVAVTCGLRGGAAAAASVPSGASTGAAEALELRDNDPARYRGLGCRKAVANVNDVIAAAVLGKELADQAALDHLLIGLDGTPNKAKLGANAILAVSLAFARACAAERGVPLYRHFADVIGRPLKSLPRLTVNLFSGGKHAGGPAHTPAGAVQMPIQDILVVPASARRSTSDCRRVRRLLRAVDRDESEVQRPPAPADARRQPAVPDIDTALADAVEAQRRRLADGRRARLDVASSPFHDDATTTRRHNQDRRPRPARQLTWSTS